MTAVTFDLNQTAPDGTVLTGTLTVTPPPPVAGPVFGINGDAFASLASSAAGAPPAVRAYTEPHYGIPAAWPGPLNGYTLPAGVKSAVVSIRPAMSDVGTPAASAALAAFAAGAPAGSALTAWHEGEAANHGFTPAQIQALHAWAYPVVKAANPALLYGQIFMAYTATPSGRHPITQWVAPGLDWYGVDGYMASSSQTPVNVFQPAFDQILAAVPDAKLAITESNADNPAWRPAWHRAAWELARQTGCLFYFPFFFAPGAGGKLAWQDTDVATVAELAAIAADSQG